MSTQESPPPCPAPHKRRPKPNKNEVRRLSDGAAEYDYIALEGHKNIGLWINQAAKAVGR